MKQSAAPRPQRKSLGDYVFDWVNNCDLSQLDAIMLALFVLIGGCGLIGGCFLMGHLQRSLAGNQQPMYVRTVVTPRATANLMIPVNVGDVQSRFGRPRMVQPGMGQAEASTGLTY
jgi:hypothetical protein